MPFGIVPSGGGGVLKLGGGGGNIGVVGDGLFARADVDILEGVDNTFEDVEATVTLRAGEADIEIV